MDFAKALDVNSMNITRMAVVGNAINYKSLLHLDDDVEMLHAVNRLYHRYNECDCKFSLIIDLPRNIVVSLNKMHEVYTTSPTASCSLLNDTIRMDGKGYTEKCRYFMASPVFSPDIKGIAYNLTDGSFEQYPLSELKKRISLSYKKNKSTAKNRNCEYSDYCVTCLDESMQSSSCNLCKLFDQLFKSRSSHQWQN